MRFLPIAVQWAFEASPTERRLSVRVRPTGFGEFEVAFDPFPRGFTPGYLTACANGNRTEYLERIAQDRALRECFDRFGVAGKAVTR